MMVGLAVYQLILSYVVTLSLHVTLTVNIITSLVVIVSYYQSYHPLETDDNVKECSHQLL